MRVNILTQERLKQILFYSLTTGQFFWLQTKSNRIKVGDNAGCIRSNGYRYIVINGEQHLSHRLAWFYVTGEWPKDEIDHKNIRKNDNSWLNLREATRSENAKNRGMQPNNTSGHIGIHFDKKSKKWQARLHGNNVTIGYFNDINDAVSARRKVEKDYYGEFYKSSIAV